MRRAKRIQRMRQIAWAHFPMRPPDGRLENQLVEYTTEHPGITLRQMIAQYYAPPPQNDPARYIQNVCSFLNCDPDDTVASLLARG